METMKKNWPLFVCTAAMIATLIACTFVLNGEMGRTLDYILRDTDSLVDYAKRHDDRSLTEDEIRRRTECEPTGELGHLTFPCGYAPLRGENR